MLEAQRRELLEQVAAIDRAIDALSTGPETAEPRPARSEVTPEDIAETMPPRPTKARRVLSDAHKQALIAGRRRAREAHDVARGLAREMPDDGFVPAIGTRAADGQPPRLVKRSAKK
jgi:hypothetical protein